LEFDPIADIQEAVGPVEVHMPPAYRVRTLDRVGPLVIPPGLVAAVGEPFGSHFETNVLHAKLPRIKPTTTGF
jgi:hypothetical protein